jgi:hypothetical protein
MAMTSDPVLDNNFEDGLKTLIPDYMRQGLRDYYYRGTPPGHFLKAVLTNDFLEMCNRADLTNQHAFMNYGRFVYNHMPIGSYGSKENYEKWMERRRPRSAETNLPE